MDFDLKFFEVKVHSELGEIVILPRNSELKPVLEKLNVLLKAKE